MTAKTASGVRQRHERALVKERAHGAVGVSCARPVVGRVHLRVIAIGAGACIPRVHVCLGGSCTGRADLGTPVQPPPDVGPRRSAHPTAVPEGPIWARQYSSPGRFLVDLSFMTTQPIFSGKGHVTKSAFQPFLA